MFGNLIEASHHDAVLVMVPTWYPWMPPMGLAYVAAYLRHRGYHPLVYDFNAKLYNSASEEGKKFWDISTISEFPLPEVVKNLNEIFSEEINKLAEILSQRPESIIGFSTNFLSIHIAGSIAQKIKDKNPRKLIVFGGPGCFWEYDRAAVSSGGVDVFVIGEGELPFYEVVDNYHKGFDLSDIKGLVICKDGNLKDNTPANPILDLDKIPFPTFKDLDLDDYGFGKKQSRTLPIGVSRGCISKCTFCIDHMMCKPFRMRNPENVVKEIEYHISVNNVGNFSFNDLLCNGDLRKLEKLCGLIIEKNLKIQWGSYAIARGDMSIALLKKMKQAGCTTICYGIESGSDKILKIMSKLYNSSDAERTLRLTYKAGMKATFNIIVGYPGEGRREFKETLNFVKKNRKYTNSIINVSTLFINPTSQLGTNPGKFNLYFPKHPTAFKALALKKLFIPHYYKIFGVNKPVLELQGIDISNFVDNRGNTKPERLRRLVKTLKIIQKLNLTKDDPIVNVYPTKSKRVKNAIQNIKERWTINSGDVSLKCNYLGFAVISYKNRIITSGPGLNAAFRIRDEWRDTSCYLWDIKKSKPNVLKVFIVMNDVKIRQAWTLKFNKSGLFWKINGFFEEKNNLPCEIKLGLQLSTMYKYWLSHRYRGEFPELGEEWRSLEFKNSGEVSAFAGKDKENDICDIIVNKVKSSEHFSLQLENSFKRYDFRFLAFKNLNFKIYNKNKFNISLFVKFKKKGNDIAEQLSPAAGDFYPPEKWSSNDLRIDKLYVKKSNGFSLKVQRDIKLYYKEKELTSLYGGNVSLRINGETFDTTDADWEISDRGRFIRCKIMWNDLSLILFWDMRLDENIMSWNFKINTQKKLKLDRIQFGIVLNNDYVNWQAGMFRGMLTQISADKKLLIPLRKLKDDKIYIESLNGYLPSVACSKPKRRGFFQIGINDLNSGGGKFLNIVIENVDLNSGKQLKFKSRFEFGI